MIVFASLIVLFLITLPEIAANSQISLLQKESEIPLEELIARYTKVGSRIASAETFFSYCMLIYLYYPCLLIGA
jgi:hypothetical protein